jgi:hypothetical protein
LKNQPADVESRGLAQRRIERSKESNMLSYVYFGTNDLEEALALNGAALGALGMTLRHW